ncbi:MAG: hypothetical protein DRR42_10470, partial [Gammaproteobacteria bacterium]
MQDNIFFMAFAALISGVIILSLALFSSVRLVRKLPDGTLKNLWEYLVYFILLFIAGYVIYGVTIWNSG